ncbi:MAG TPA: response regulator [Gemmatimonadaceae bacterium]
MSDGTTMNPVTAAAVVRAADDAIVTIAPDRTITSWNPGAERVYGYAAPEVVGKPLSTIVPADIRAAEEALVARALSGAHVPAFDTTRLHKQGNRLVVSVSFVPLQDDGGSIIGMASIARNVTAQRALEAQLLQVKRMETVGRLAGGIAQEFNNINTAILGLVEFVLKDLPPHSPVRDDLEEITQQAHRGSRLARHLLAFSGRQIITTDWVKAGEMLRTLEPLLQRLASERIWLTLDLSEADPPVRADPSQLEVVIFELVQNACDAIGERGSIVISTRVAKASETPIATAEPNADVVVIEVRDSGPGVSARAAASAIEPFYSTKPSHGHLGLGLAMVYGVMRQLGGSVSIHAAAGDESGTVATLFLPTADVSAEVESAATSATAPREREPEAAAPHAVPAASRHELTGSETVLVVEDEEPVRDVICRALRGYGYNVLEAKNGEDAITVAGRYGAPVHIVVSDVVMPEMDGRVLFEHLRGWYPHIRFLFISGYARGNIGAEQLASPATQFLAKPFSMNTLVSEVRRLLDTPRP